MKLERKLPPREINDGVALALCYRQKWATTRINMLKSRQIKPLFDIFSYSPSEIETQNRDYLKSQKKKIHTDTPLKPETDNEGCIIHRTENGHVSWKVTAYSCIVTVTFGENIIKAIFIRDDSRWANQDRFIYHEAGKEWMYLADSKSCFQVSINGPKNWEFQDCLNALYKSMKALLSKEDSINWILELEKYHQAKGGKKLTLHFLKK